MSSKDVIIEQLKSLEKTRDTLGKCILAAEYNLEINDFEEFYKGALKIQSLSEKIILRSREIPGMTGVPQYIENVEDVIIEESDMKIEYTKEGWFHVRFPSLLPKKEKGSPTYIRSTLMTGLKRYFIKNEQKIFEDPCVIIFKHNYSKDRPDREYRDHDNIELNAVVDLITLYVLIDDMPMKLSHYYYSSIEDEDSTEVFIVPVVEFGNFIEKSK